MKKANQKVMWAGDVEGGEFGYGWRDVQAARGRSTDAPATRAVRIQLRDDGITLCCFSPDIMLHVDVDATAVTANENVQIAIPDEHKTFGDILAGMRKQAGIAHLELHGADAGASETLWQPQMLMITWGGEIVGVPVAEMAEARFDAIADLLESQTPVLGVQHLSHTSNVLKRLGNIGKHVSFTFYGSDMPIGIRTTDNVQGAILAHVIDLRPAEPGGVEVAEAARFLDSMRKATPAGAQEPEGDFTLQKDADGNVVPFKQKEQLDDAEPWEEPRPELDEPEDPQEP